MRTMSQDEAIAKFKGTHGNTFDYSEVEYKRSNKPVTIICKVEGHGPFKQKPCDHIYGSGCPACGHRKGKTTKTPKAPKVAKVKAPKVARVASSEKFSITPERENRIKHFMESTGCNRGAALKRVKREEAKSSK
jgi:hypothetical protein